MRKANKTMKETIEVYTFSLRKSRSPKKLSFAMGADIYKLVKKEFVNYVHNSTGDMPAEKRTVKIPTAKDGEKFWGFDDKMRCFYGLIESGIYGKSLEIAHKDDPEKILYQSKKEEALMKPFFYLIGIPHVGDVAYLILERTDNEGVFPMFRSIMKTFLDKNLGSEDDKYSIDFSNYLSKEYVMSLKNGTLKTIRFNLRSLPEDGADKYFLKDLGDDIQVSLSVTFRGGLMPGSKIRKAIEDPNEIFTSYDMKGLFGDSHKSIITTSKINGVEKDRTVYLDDEYAKQIRPYYVLDVMENSRGYSEYASIRDAVMKFIKDNEDLSKLV